MNKQKIRKIIIVSLVVLSVTYCLSSVSAEKLVLKSGQEIEGKITERTDKYIMIDFYGVAQPYYFEDIKNIDGAKVIPGSTANEVLYGFHRKGIEYASQGRFEEARKQFNKVLEMCSIYSGFKDGIKLHLRILDDISKGKMNKEYASYLFKGEGYICDKDFQQGITYLQKAIQIEPNDFNVYNYLGTAYYYSGQYQEALVYFKKTVQIEPNYIHAYCQIGSIYYLLGQHEDGITYFQKAIQISPDNPEAYTMLGFMFANLGRYKEAKENLQKGRKIYREEGNHQFVKIIDQELNKPPFVTYVYNISTYYYNMDNVPQICFFPSEKARWDGYRVLVENWKELTAYQKNMFVIESIKEIEDKEHLTVGYTDGISKLSMALDEITYSFELEGKGKITVISLIFQFLVKYGYIKEEGQRITAMHRGVFDSIKNPLPLPEVEFFKIYTGYIDCYQKDDVWLNSPPAIGEKVKNYLIYSKYAVYPNGSVMLTEQYPLDKEYKISSLKEINSFPERDDCTVHYYEITFELLI